MALSYGTPNVVSLSPASPMRAGSMSNASLADRVSNLEMEVQRAYEVMGGVSSLPGASAMTQASDAYFYWEP